MDFRPVDRSHVKKARSLALRGLLNYQPFIFDDSLAVGAGLSIVAGYLQDTPLVYCPDVRAGEVDAEYLKRTIVRPEQKADFFAANERMRRFYDGTIDQVTAALGTMEGMSILDVGCNSGYFPIAFARRGASKVVGLDRVDYGGTIKLLNQLCGTHVEFRLWSYDGAVEATERFDLVTSIAVLVHLSDPLQHLAWLGSSARKALFVFTPCHDEDNYSIRFHAVNRYYQDRFPYCFDVCTLSRKLLRLAFERMGFTKMVEIETPAESMSAQWSRAHLGLLGIRENAPDSSAAGRAEIG